MKIRRKEKKSFLYTGVILLFSGISLLFYLVIFIGVSDDFLPNFGKLSSVIMIIFGIVNLVKYDKYTQAKDVDFTITNNFVNYNGQQYSLKDKFLTIRSAQEKDFYRVSLWIEQGKTAEKIFEHVVFDIEEMALFLKMIKPYRKSDVCPIENSEKIKLFENGFIFENQEILYDEIESFDAKRIDINGAKYLDIDIKLKNGQRIDTRLAGGTKEYAKALYANMQYVDPNIAIKCNAKYKGLLGWIVVAIDIILVFSFFFDYGDESLIYWIIIITTLYLTFNTTDTMELCEEIEKLQQK